MVRKYLWDKISLILALLLISSSVNAGVVTNIKAFNQSNAEWIATYQNVITDRSRTLVIQNKKGSQLIAATWNGTKPSQFADPTKVSHRILLKNSKTGATCVIHQNFEAYWLFGSKFRNYQLITSNPVLCDVESIKLDDDTVSVFIYLRKLN